MIAITGATGFLGRKFVTALKAKNHDFVCLGRFNSAKLTPLGPADGKIRFVDFESSESLCKAMQGSHTIVHLIGLVNGKEENLRRANIEVTRAVVRAASLAKVSKIIYVSSVAAGSRHGFYGQSKFEAEEIIRDSGLPFLIFRPAFIYGDGDENNTGLMIRTLKRFPWIPLLGGGDFKLQPVYVDDVISLLLQGLNDSHVGRVYIVAGPQQISLRQILEYLAKALGLTRTFIPMPLRPVQTVLKFYANLFKNTRLPVKQILELDKHEVFDISKTQQDFNFNPIPFNEGVERMFQKKLCVA